MRDAVFIVLFVLLCLALSTYENAAHSFVWTYDGVQHALKLGK